MCFLQMPGRGIRFMSSWPGQARSACGRYLILSFLKKSKHMKTPWILSGALLCLVACQSGTNEAKEPAAAEETSAAKEETPLPADVYYKGESSIGSRENMVTVMNWNRYMEGKMLDSAAGLLADSVYLELADGAVFNTTRDSLMAVIRDMMNGYDSLKVGFVAVMPVNVKTQEGTDEWVFSWTDERFYGKKGEEHHNIHEDYQLKNGKIWKVYQYGKKPIPEAPKN